MIGDVLHRYPGPTARLFLGPWLAAPAQLWRTFFRWQDVGELWQPRRHDNEHRFLRAGYLGWRYEEELW